MDERQKNIAISFFKYLKDFKGGDIGTTCFEEHLASFRNVFPELKEVKLGKELRDLIAKCRMGVYSKTKPAFNFPIIIGVENPAKDRRITLLNDLIKEKDKEINTLSKSTAVQEQIIEAVKDHLVIYEPYENPAEYKPSNEIDDESKEKEQLCLMVSDWHYGERVSLVQTSGINEYSVKIAEERVAMLYANTIKIAEEQMKLYKYDTLNILALGDMVSGVIHEELLKTNDLPIIQQGIDGGLLFADLIRKFAGYFKTINVHCVVGNHGRTTAKQPSKNRAGESVDTVFYRTAEIKCDDLGNVTFDIPDSPLCKFEIFDFTFALRHGDCKTQNFASIPFYGVLKTDSTLTETFANEFNKKLMYHCIGHYHMDASMPKTNGGQILINASLVGTSEHGMAAYLSTTKPSQKLFSIHPKYGKTWEMKVRVTDN